MSPSAIKINELFQAVGLPMIPPGQIGFYELLESNVAKLVAVAQELQAKLNHESYVSDKRAVERDNAERERDRLAEKVAALEASNAELKQRLPEPVCSICGGERSTSGICMTCGRYA